MPTPKPIPPAVPLSSTGAAPHLDREIGLLGATALNMIDMIGVGPFITIPLIVSAMGGPQAMLGWALGALFALCDGLVWAELGAAMPGAGGSYRYLNEIYGPKRLGRMISFLFIWQLSFSAPLSIASGCIGLAKYATYLFPSLDHLYFSRNFALGIPGFGPLEAHIVVAPTTFLAIGACLVAVLLLYRKIDAIARLSTWLFIGVIGTIGWIIFAGATHFSPARAFSFPPGAFTFSTAFLHGLGSAMLIAAYDYWGYYNVCFLGGEVKKPERNIPRALLLSIVLVAALYLVMNISILGVIPWQDLDAAAKSNSRLYFASTLMHGIYGAWAGKLICVLVMWTAFASVFSLLLGYSRVPYAAAVDGNYFSAFSRLHPKSHFPYVSLLALGIVASVFCLLQLADVIAALAVIRIMLQYLVQSIGVIVLRVRRPDMPRPFRMWLFPVPAVLASAGFLFVLVSRQGFMKEIRYATVILLAGIVIFLLRSWRRGEWPFGPRAVLDDRAVPVNRPQEPR